MGPRRGQLSLDPPPPLTPSVPPNDWGGLGEQLQVFSRGIRPPPRGGEVE
jgi:hypothetical protein